MTYRERIASILLRQDRFSDSLVGGYVTSMERIVARAQADVLADLARALDIDDNGLVRNTAANRRALRQLNRRFIERLEARGFARLTDAFVDSFDGQLPFFQEILKALSATMKTPLPEIAWSAADIRAFAGMKLAAGYTLENVAEFAGARAVRQASFTLAGMQWRDLVGVIAQEFTKTAGEAGTIGSTALATFYRSIASRGYEIIEAEMPELVQRYFYAGPNDKLCRPFCARQIAHARRGQAYTRQQIDAMDNGSSLSNVFVNCGGWNCRHQWALAPYASQ